MIYPATLNIEILQNSTFKVVFRVLEKYQQIKLLEIVDGILFFNVPCHRLTAGTKVTIIPQGSGTADLMAGLPAPEAPCELDLNAIYFVSATGLTSDSFAISATEGGTRIAVSELCCDSPALWVAEPSDLTGCTLDADLIEIETGAQVATFTCVLEDQVNGLCSASMAPSVTTLIDARDYGWDASITKSNGERYYYLTGSAPVRRTRSRNN